MNKFLFTTIALLILTLSSEAFTYGGNAPINSYGGNNAIIRTAPTANGSAQSYQDMVNASNYRNRNRASINHRYYDMDSNKNVSPRKMRKHGSAANKRK